MPVIKHNWGCNWKY